MLETFCLRLAAGLTLALLVLPIRIVSARFYRSQLLLVLCLVVTAGILSWHDDAEATLLWAALGSAGGLAIGAFWLWSAQGVRLGTAALGLLAAALLLALARLASQAGGSTNWAWAAADGTASAAFLGLATTAMLMGHWYLIASTMSLDPLMRLLAWLGAANVGRLVLSALGVWQAGNDGITFDRLAWMWLSVRVLAGLLAPLGLTWMAWQSARIRSTQSATGILYVVVILVFFGELTDMLFQEHLAELQGPAS